MFLSVQVNSDVGFDIYPHSLSAGIIYTKYWGWIFIYYVSLLVYILFYCIDIDITL